MTANLLIFYTIGVAFVISVSLTILFIFSRCNIKINSKLIYLLILASVYMLVTQYLKYLSLHFYADFSHWAQIIFNISKTGKPYCLSAQFLYPIGINFLSVHFVPLVYLFAIPFKIFPNPQTIIFFNFVLMFSSIIPLYKLSLLASGKKQFAVFISALFLWYPTFQYIVLYEFEMLRFSIPIIFWMLYFWENKNLKGFYIFVFLAVLIREEVGLTIMMFGIYLLFAERKYRIGLTTALIGLISFIVITQIVMPSLSDSESYSHLATRLFSTFGNNFGEIIKNIITHPLSTLKTIFIPIKLANIFMLFLPVLFIPLLAPYVLVSTLAILAIGMLSASEMHISYMLYYVSASVPFIFYAFIKGWPKFLVLMDKLVKKTHLVNPISSISSTAMASVLSGLMAANVFFGPSPLSLQFWFKDIRPAPFRTQNFHYSVYKITPHHRKAEEFANLIPDSAIVSSQQFLSPILFKKRGVMIFPRLESLDNIIKANYVFFDKTNNGLNKISPAYTTQQIFDSIEKDKKTWQLINSEDNYFLYKRIGKS